MCVELAFGKKNISVKNEFRANGNILLQNEKFRLGATPVEGAVYWDGWIRKEDVTKWTDGAWTRAELFANKFNQRGRWYDVPPGEVIKGIAFSTGERIILKVITRESVGRETKVQQRFALTGKRLLIPRS